ncbi:MAG: hypothetical protein Q4F65_06950 [Propionibacteriaceae bacterium]|nr:hypothetical protein [Propionibacteriaceae bacterium]
MMTPALRDHLAQELRVRVGHLVEVLPHGVDGSFAPPVLVIGQPDVEFRAWGCEDLVTIGLAVVVRHHPDGPAATQRALEELWPQVAAQVKSLCHEDPSLGGLVTLAELKTAEFGDFTVQGQSFPAQQIALNVFVS